ncbi:MAG: peptidoglycan DD-metalloendopeptidase family protein [Muribaculaceae bacterium]
MLKRVSALIAIFVVCAGVACAQTNSAKQIKQQKATTQRQIRETNTKIKANKAATARSLNQLNSITAEIAQHQTSINQLNEQLQSINEQLALVNDSIAQNEQKLQDLRNEYGKAVKRVHTHTSSLDKLLFLFQSQSFHQAMRRMRYLREFSRWRKKQTDEIGVMQQRLEDSRNHINALATDKSNAIKNRNLAKLTLEQKKQQQAGVVKKLRSEGAQLQEVLTEQQRKAAALDRELNRIIEQERLAAERAERERKEAAERERKRKEAERLAAEQKQKEEAADQQKRELAEQQKKKDGEKASEKKSSKKSKKDKDKKKSQEPAKPNIEPITVTKPDLAKQPGEQDANAALKGTFASNKGKLPYPVTGKFKIVRHFGVQQHPQLKYVKTENGGIDIETHKGAVARAVFAGKVSAIFRQDGFNTVVMVRHGSYLTIYVNLSEIYVHTGETVKPNQNIGKIYSDPEDDDRTILHFEVRKEKEKLNPELWLRR